jgi:hypothetical protein
VICDSNYIEFLSYCNLTIPFGSWTALGKDKTLLSVGISFWRQGTRLRWRISPNRRSIKVLIDEKQLSYQPIILAVVALSCRGNQRGTVRQDSFANFTVFSTCGGTASSLRNGELMEDFVPHRPKYLAEKLLQNRRSLELSQKQLARAIGIDKYNVISSMREYKRTISRTGWK